MTHLIFWNLDANGVERESIRSVVAGTEFDGFLGADPKPSTATRLARERFGDTSPRSIELATKTVSTAEFGALLSSMVRGTSTRLGLAGVPLRGSSGGVWMVPESVSIGRARMHALERVAGLADGSFWALPVRETPEMIRCAVDDLSSWITYAEIDLDDLYDRVGDRKLPIDGRILGARLSTCGLLSDRVDRWSRYDRTGFKKSRQRLGLFRMRILAMSEIAPSDD